MLRELLLYVLILSNILEAPRQHGFPIRVKTLTNVFNEACNNVGESRKEYPHAASTEPAMGHVGFGNCLGDGGVEVGGDVEVVRDDEIGFAREGDGFGGAARSRGRLGSGGRLDT